ncbi:DNA-binding XRE family transcriptional regulator [Enterococcus sp. PF1-24]|uniref:helix-turn-helix transcriptional regulator n=1 Tax=unclassified Enterococcus TaxID=2608891 RepID=UPI0024766097|nr:MULTISPECIES: helix-turn-helix transcriptional regulator [unclassified Enterococcus]MDH6365397.1 DNA-binding XRE family transcriptional regulator [Enterococcus sp. PFB1-1]MDH6402498.1 DNA-binding XRE family transcriptional regulator [Enterococcus sp. PF1-24]
MLTNKIKEYREKQNITQQEIADLTDVRRETISRLEQNKYNPSLELAMKIAYYLNVSVEELFNWEKDQ